MRHQVKKRFGQHFLVDQGVITQIVNSIACQNSDHVIEIGPGMGAMTQLLLDRLDHLSIVEIDRDLIDYWEKQGLSKLTIYGRDVLKFDFSEWFKTTAGPGQHFIVGNLPYNISSPILFHLVQYANQVTGQIFMLQKEVIDRMLSQAGDSEFGRLSVMLQARYDMSLVLDVPPECFDPPPKVDSAVVRMVPKKDFSLSSEEYLALEKIVTQAFSQRRKVLRNNLSSFKDLLGMTEQELGQRAQEITVERYIEWAKAWAISHKNADQ